MTKRIQEIKQNDNIDFIIVNAENAAQGMGLTQDQFKRILAQDVNVVTMGNHTWGKKDIFNFIDHPQIIRPANYTKGVLGKGYNIFESKNKKIAVINLIGRVEMNILSENPFVVAKEIIDKIKSEVDIIIIDFHAEATAEKIAMANYLDGEATMIFGTHTHVQTADEKIMPKGTGYITDIGMTGPKDSVIGMEIEVSIKRMVTSMPERYKIAQGDAQFNGIIFDIDEETNKIQNISRISM